MSLHSSRVTSEPAGGHTAMAINLPQQIQRIDYLRAVDL
jgi:hypothetical protein